MYHDAKATMILPYLTLIYLWLSIIRLPCLAYLNVRHLAGIWKLTTQTNDAPSDILLLLREDGKFLQYSEQPKSRPKFGVSDQQLEWEQFGRSIFGVDVILRGSWDFVDGKLILATDRHNRLQYSESDPTYTGKDTILEGRVVATKDPSLQDHPALTPTEFPPVSSNSFDVYLSVPNGKVKIGKYAYPLTHPSFFDQPLFDPIKLGSFHLQQIAGELNAKLDKNLDDDYDTVELFKKEDLMNKRYFLTTYPLPTFRQKRQRWSIKYNSFVDAQPKSKEEEALEEQEKNDPFQIRTVEVMLFANNTFSTFKGLGQDMILRGKWSIIGENRDQLLMQVWRFGFGRSVSGSTFSEGANLSQKDAVSYWGKIYEVEKGLGQENQISTDPTRDGKRIEVNGNVMDGWALEPCSVARFTMVEITEEDEETDEEDDETLDELEACIGIFRDTMWGGLRQSLANAAVKGAENIQNSGGLIAKIGQVVAPQEEEYEEENSQVSENEDDIYDDDDVYEYDEDTSLTENQAFGGVGKFLGGVMHTAKATASRLTASLEHTGDHPPHAHVDAFIEPIVPPVSHVPSESTDALEPSAVGRQAPLTHITRETVVAPVTSSADSTAAPPDILSDDLSLPCDDNIDVAIFHQDKTDRTAADTNLVHVGEQYLLQSCSDEQSIHHHANQEEKPLIQSEEIHGSDINTSFTRIEPDFIESSDTTTSISNQTQFLMEDHEPMHRNHNIVDYALFQALQLEKDTLNAQLQESYQLVQRLQLESLQLQHDTQSKLQLLTQTHEEEIHRMLEDSTLQYTKLEVESKNALAKMTESMLDMEKKHNSALERLENKLTWTIRDNEEKDQEVEQLKRVIADMRTKLKQAVAAEEEADELDLENEELHKTVQGLQHELEQLKLERKRREEEQTDLMGVRMELDMVKEERNRQKEKHEAVLETHMINLNKMMTERDAARAQAVDLEQQLAATIADWNIAKTDLSRVLAMNSNLQRALEAFQVEREAEMALWEESRISAEQALIDAHRTELKAIRDTSDQMIRDIQLAADKAVTNMMQDLSLSEQKIEEYRKECITTRRSLDEAIHQLQRSQEDVIDRSVIKNILIDWHSKSGKAKKDVMSLISNLLHFNDEEKEKCGLGSSSGSLAEKVAVAVVPPLIPPAKSVDQLEGDTVRDKFVNFLLAELGDDRPPLRHPENENKS